MNLKRMNKLNIYNTIAWLSIALLMLVSACQDKEEDNALIIDESYTPIKVAPISGLRIGWDQSSLSQLSFKGSSPKIIRESETLLSAVYQSDDNIYWMQSQNNGLSWNQPKLLFPKTTHKGMDGDNVITYNDLMSQPTIIKLQNGDLLVACAVRYNYILTTVTPAVTMEFPAGILVRRITGGTDLQPVKEVYINLGCETPSLLELPDGDIHLYFTNGNIRQPLKLMSSTELPIAIEEQKIDMISSKDHGQTWTSSIKEFGPDGESKRWEGAKTIAARAKKNNVYPSATIAGEEIVVAFADNKTVSFKPYVVRTPINNNWPFTINGDTPERDYARYEILPDKYYMGNPNILTLSSGETLMSYETDANRMDAAETMEVVIGSNKGSDFTKATQPFPFTANVRAVSNSLMQFDDNTIVAMTSSNYQYPTSVAPWYIKGHLINDLTIKNSEITEYPIFVGAKSDANVKVGLGIDASNLYVKAKAIDYRLVAADAGSQKGDGIYLYIDAANLSLLDVDKGISKLWISYEGDVTRWDGKEGAWVAGSADGIAVTHTAQIDGYSLDITIPTSKLTNFNKAGIRFAVGLNDYISSEQGTTEMLSLSKDLRSSSWLGVTF